jgi:GPH family glycoside/pentoside/hexuronide:cation symporter
MILLENLATLAGVPLWLGVSMRIGKHRALMAAALWIALWSLPLVGLRAGDTSALIVTVVIRGSSFASILFLANSIAADVIDVDTLASGEQRSGLYFAVWGMVTKLSLAIGVLLGTTLPAAFGYDPSAEVAPTEVQARLMSIYGGVPAILMALGALFLLHFPITRERHAEIRAALSRRQGSSTTGRR